MNYKEEVKRTLNVSLNKEQLLVNASLGLCGESGEFADLVKKNVFHKHTLDRDKAIKELGDIRWYIEAACYALDVSLEEVEKLNIEKLRKRYPTGFSPQDSINRKE